MSFDLYQTRADLQAGWQTLHDVDKASRIAQILDAGMGGRTLARSLNVSEALVRHLAIANEARPEEKQLARQGRLSTNQLVKLVKVRRKQTADVQREAEAEKGAVAARRGAKVITSWLAGKLQSAYAEQVIDEARHRLAEAEAAGKLPKFRAPKGMKVSEIIRRLEPKPSADDVSFVDRYAHWLARWSFFAFPNAEVRDRALDHAWEVFIH